MDLDVSRNKRQRSISSALSSSSGSQLSQSRSRSSSPSAPPPKYHRAPETDNDKSYTCNLPPTCSQPSTSTSYASESELQRHQETFHRWVCRTPIKERYQPTGEHELPEGFGSKRKGNLLKECGKVFPNERLLDLHQTETHDPIAKSRQDRGVKIFACFIPPPECTRFFGTPAKRRRHLIDKHHYPEQYFFSITNHGINKIAQEDGLAISLIRPRRNPPKSLEHTSGENTPNHVSRNSLKTGTESRNTSDKDQTPQSPDGRLLEEMKKDFDMESLVQNMESSSQFVPRGVRKK